MQDVPKRFGHEDFRHLGFTQGNLPSLNRVVWDIAQRLDNLGNWRLEALTVG